LLSQEKGQVSRGSNDIPTRLTPQRTFILYLQTQINFIKKMGKKYTRGGTRQKPSEQKGKSKKQKEKKREQSTTVA